VPEGVDGGEQPVPFGVTRCWGVQRRSRRQPVPIAAAKACRLLPFKANRLANVIAGGIMTPKRIPDLRAASGQW